MQGVLDTSVMADDMLSAGHRLADAAKAGKWPAVMTVLDSEWSWLVINQWRPGGTRGSPPSSGRLDGAPTEVVAELLDRGALRSLRDSKGRTAFDVAAEHDRTPAFRELLRPPRSPLTREQIRALDARLAELIGGRIHGRVYDGDLRTVLRYPPVEILHELPGQRVWFPIPAKYGFHIELQRGALESRAGAAWSKGPAKRTWSPPKARSWSIKDSSDQGIGWSCRRTETPTTAPVGGRVSRPPHTPTRHTPIQSSLSSTLRVRTTKEANHDFDCCTT